MLNSYAVYALKRNIIYSINVEKFKTILSLKNTAMVLHVSYEILKFKIKPIQNTLKDMKCNPPILT